MPTYDYRCNGCGHTYELFQSMKDKPVKKCPACKKATAERLIGIGAAVLFKGSGFYQTDYRSEGYKKSAEADKPATSTAGVAATESGTPAPAADKKTETPAPAAKSDGAKGEPTKTATQVKESAPAKESSASKEKKPTGKAGSKSR